MLLVSFPLDDSVVEHVAAAPKIFAGVNACDDNPHDLVSKRVHRAELRQIQFSQHVATMVAQTNGFKEFCIHETGQRSVQKEDHERRNRIAWGEDKVR